MRFVRLISAFAVGTLATVFALDCADAAPEIGDAAPALVLTALDGRA